MKKFIQLAMPSGHVYEIPTEVIAKSRTAYYALNTSEFPTIEAAQADTEAAFEDTGNIADWAANNMSWEDLHPHARMIRYTAPGATDWMNGEWSFHDAPALMGELDGDNILQSPVAIILQAMSAQAQMCNVTILSQPDGEPYAALALIIGTPPILNTYINGLQTVGNHLMAPALAAAESTTMN